MAELTPNNIEAFNKNAEKRFVEKAKKRVREYIDADLQACYSDAAIDTFTELGIKAAREHHLISEGEIFDYLQLMIYFGAYFDQDQHYYWLDEYIQGDPDKPMQGHIIHGVSIGRNYQRMLYFPVDVWLTRFEQLKKEYTGFNLMATKPLGRNQLLAIMKNYNPDDALIITGDILEQIYQQTLPEMQHYKIKAPDSHIIWFILTVDLGFRFYDNPLYPEIPAILNSDAAETERLNQLLTLKIECLKKRWDFTQHHTQD